MSKRLFSNPDEIDQRARDRGAEVPSPPDQCSRAGCRGDTAIALAAVSEPGRGDRVGPGSEFMGAGRTLRQGFRWNGWITRCADCYTQDLYRTRKGVWSTITENPRGIPSLEEVRAHRKSQEKANA